ncbi:MAG: dual specificity protein phosphatase family protein [Myxococcales bacterium]|nr:dual specificity protein phosphatase family protein [Myxococcales bacterium]
MRYALAFGTICAVSCAVLVAVEIPILRLAASWSALSFGLAAAAYAGLGPGVLGKRADGALPPWSIVLNGPFLLFGLASMRFVNATSPAQAYDRVAPGLLLGRRPTGADVEAVDALDVCAVVDLCAELPRSRLWSGDEVLLMVSVLDAMAPSQAQLAQAVSFIDAHLHQGPVLVHCALGRSRSATVVAAWMLARGHCGTVAEAEAALRVERPSVWFTPPQAAALEAFRVSLGTPSP